MRRIGQTFRQDLEHPFAGARTRGQPDPLEHRRNGDKHSLGPQMRKHRLHNRLAAIGRPSGIGADLRAGTPVSQAEAAQAQQLLQFDGMFASCLVAQRIISKGGRRHADLKRDESDHRLGRMLAKSQALAGMAQQAKLNSEAQSVAAPPLGADERQVVGAEHVAFRHLWGFSRNAEQAGALLGRQKGTAGHRGLRLMTEGRS